MATLIHSPLSLERFQDGTAAAPSIAFASAPGNGFFYKNAVQIGISVAGVEGGNIWIPSSNTIRFAGAGNSYFEATNTGALNLVAAGTNQNITLTPSGTGSVVIPVNSIRMSSGDADKVVLNTYAGGAHHVLSSESGWGLGIKAGGTTSGTQSSIRLMNWTGAAYVEQARLVNSGSLLLGTTTDSSNGRLQLTTHTTSAGGIAFGTDMTFYRIDSRTMAIDSTDASGRSNLTWRNNGADQFEVYNDTAQALVGTRNSRPFILRANQLTVLTLDTSQNATFANHITIGTNGTFAWASKGGIWASSDGVFRLANNANTDFSRLQFGGTTSSFPALKRNGADVEIRNGDDTAYTRIYSAQHRLTGAAGTAAAGQIELGGTTASTVGAAGAASALPANPLGYIIINVAGTAAKIPYYNN